MLNSRRGKSTVPGVKGLMSCWGTIEKAKGYKFEFSSKSKEWYFKQVDLLDEASFDLDTVHQYLMKQYNYCIINKIVIIIDRMRLGLFLQKFSGTPTAKGAIMKNESGGEFLEFPNVPQKDQIFTSGLLYLGREKSFRYYVGKSGGENLTSNDFPNMNSIVRVKPKTEF